MSRDDDDVEMSVADPLITAVVRHARTSVLAVGESDEDAAARVMQRVRNRPRPATAATMAWPVPARWLAAASLAIVMLGAVALRRAQAPAPGTPPTRFVLVAPAAAHAAVVGDFNAWDRHATPMQRDQRTGAWSAELPLVAGQYTYAFVVDDSAFVPDPSAPLAADNDYGRRNSVLMVSTAGARHADR